MFVCVCVCVCVRACVSARARARVCVCVKVGGLGNLSKWVCLHGLSAVVLFHPQAVSVMDTVRFSAIVIPEFAGKHLLLAWRKGAERGGGRGRRG